MSVQFIEKDGQPVFAVLPYEDYRKLLAAAEDAGDARAFDAWQRAPGETVPAAVVDRLITGESPIRVWREHRGLSQGSLAEAAGITTSYLSQIENGRRQPSLETAHTLAKALAIDVDDLLPAARGAE